MDEYKKALEQLEQYKALFEKNAYGSAYGNSYRELLMEALEQLKKTPSEQLQGCLQNMQQYQVLLQEHPFEKLMRETREKFESMPQYQSLYQELLKEQPFEKSMREFREKLLELSKLAKP